MPIDYSILLPREEPKSALQTFQEVSGVLQQQQAQKDARTAALEAARAKRDAALAAAKDEQAIKEAFAANPDDLDGVLTSLAGKVSTGAYESLAKFADEHRDKTLKAAIDGFKLDEFRRDTEARKLAIGSQSRDLYAKIFPTLDKQTQGLVPTPDEWTDGTPNQPGTSEILKNLSGAAAGDANARVAARRAALEEYQQSKKDTADQVKAMRDIAATTATKEDYAAKLEGFPLIFSRKAIAEAGLPPAQGWTREGVQALAVGPAKTAELAATAARTKTDDDRQMDALEETKRHNRVMEGVQAGQGLGTGAGVTPTGPKGQDYLQALPEGERAVVKALAEGRMPWPSAMALKTPLWSKRIDEVFQYDPTFDSAMASSNARQKVRNDFTSGKSAQQVNALNTAIGHLDQLDKAAVALNNGDITALNAAENWFKTKFTGWTGKTNFDTIAPRVAQEITRVWRGTGGSEADIKRDIDVLSSSNAPAQLKESLGNLLGLLKSKIDALQDQYRQGMGIVDIDMMTPESRAVMKKFGIGGGDDSGAAGGRERVEIGPDGKLRLVGKGGG